MDFLHTILIFLKKLLLASVTQFVGLMAIFFFFGLILYFLARLTRVVFVKSIGQKFDIYITGWLGTPIHELGHAIFCVIFRHKITDMKLFSPDSKKGTLGYVNHVYNANNPWHNIGNFFIGFGPILFGSFILYLLLKFFIPDNSALNYLNNNNGFDLSTLNGLKNQAAHLFSNGKVIINQLFSKQNIHSWQFWLFLYVAICIASHMELSPSDLKGVWSGLVSIFILLIVINSISLFLNVNISSYVLSLSKYTNMISGIFTFAVVVSALFFISAFILLNIYTLVRYRKLFHPIA